MAPDFHLLLKRHITDVESFPLKLDDIAFLQRGQLGFPDHLELMLEENRASLISLNQNEKHFYLRILVDILLEVIVFRQDSFGNNMIVMGADHWHEWSLVRDVGQPSQLDRILIILKLTTSLQTVLFLKGS